jgi:hypothetical protein
MSSLSNNDPSQITEIEINGEKLTCQVCGQDSFTQRKGQLNTAVASFFGFDWANPTATCYICISCGYVHWFMKQS